MQATPALIVADDGYFRHTALPRYAAVATPVFSLRTHESVGSGEFLDIKILVDICNAAGTSGLSWLVLRAHVGLAALFHQYIDLFIQWCRAACRLLGTSQLLPAR